MQRIPLALLALVTLLALSGCTNISDDITEASVLAHWSQASAAFRCDDPDPMGCVGSESGSAFQNLVADRWATKQRTLVRIAAHQGGGNPSSPAPSRRAMSRTITRPALTPLNFVDEHNSALLRTSERLVHFAVWRRPNGQIRVAGIWGPRPAGTLRDEVRLDLSWTSSAPQDAIHESDSYHLEQIEVLTSPGGGAPYIAALWRPGTKRSELIHGEQCEIGPDPYQVGVAAADSGEPCAVQEPPLALGSVELGEESTEEEPHKEGAHCAVFHELEHKAKATPSMRPVDFELYTEGGMSRIAIVLQDEPADDWILVPGSWEAVHCRNQLLGLKSERSKSYGLMDLDLIDPAWYAIPDPEEQLHNGLVHDGGTAGGPPGG